MVQDRRNSARADVIVIGGGIIGGSIAWHLLCASPKTRVVCIEKTGVAAGSTSRSAAAFRHQFSSRVNIEMSLLSAREYARFDEEFGCGEVFMRQGYLFLYSDPAAEEAAAARVARQRELGVERVRLLRADEVNRLDGLAGIFDTSRIAFATWCPDDGFVHPTTVAQAYFDRARELGLELHAGTDVLEVLRRAGRVHGVRLRDGTEIEAPIVVNAAGWWSNHVARMAGLEIPALPAKRYLYVTRQLRTRQVSHYPLIVFDLGPYMRPEHNGLMMGWDERPPKPDGLATFPPPALDYEALEAEQDSIDPGFDKGPEGYGFEILVQIAEFVPYFEEEVGLEHVTCGYYTITPDEKAILSWDPRLEGLLHATGFSGHGIMHAPAAGAAVTALITGTPPPFDLAPLRLDQLLVNASRDDPELMVI